MMAFPRSRILAARPADAVLAAGCAFAASASEGGPGGASCNALTLSVGSGSGTVQAGPASSGGCPDGQYSPGYVVLVIATAERRLRVLRLDGHGQQRREPNERDDVERQDGDRQLRLELLPPDDERRERKRHGSIRRRRAPEAPGRVVSAGLQRNPRRDAEQRLHVQQLDGHGQQQREPDEGDDVERQDSHWQLRASDLLPPDDQRQRQRNGAGRPTERGRLPERIVPAGVRA